MSLSPTKSIKIGLITAICLIVANMVGTGVFTSLGFQALGIKSVFGLLFLWVLGGFIALFGALTYGELAVAFPRSGGEYNYLSRLYHPALGFLSGWVSATVGFAAPMAISAMAFGGYFSKVFPYLSPIELASGLIVLLTIINVSSFKFGSTFQTFFTIFNILLIISISVAGIFAADHDHFKLTFHPTDFESILDPAFAVSLVYVSFAYSGWNSATYVAGEIKNPEKNLPRALFLGTLIVLFLYIVLNFVFLYAVPIDQLAGQMEVGFIAATTIFGSEGGIVISCIISIGLLASVNALMIAGPRVTQVIGEDFSWFKILAHKNKTGSPVYATLLQSAFALLLIITFTFDKILTYIGFTLSFFTTLTVAGVFILRYRTKEKNTQYKTWGYPYTPILFILLEIWMMIYIAQERPLESLAGFLTVLSGLIVFMLINKKQKQLI